jgi:hypothetical protein
MKMTRSIKFGYELEFLTSLNATSVANRITALTGINVVYQSADIHNSVSSDFKIVTDVSVKGLGLNGYELVSRPYTDLSQFTSHLRQIKAVLNKKCDVQFNDTCGLHIHHDIATNSLTKMDIVKVVKYYAQSDHLISNLVGKKRLHNRFCKPYTAIEEHFNDANDSIVLDRYEKDIMSENLYEPDSVALNPRSSIRYRNINVAAKNRHQTLEFRAMQSTLDIDDTVRWIEFTNALMYKASSFKVLDTFARRTPTMDNIEAMFKKLQLSFDDYKEFYN